MSDSYSRPIPDATSPYTELARAKTQNADDRSASPSVAWAVSEPSSVTSTTPSEEESPSTLRPMDSGDDRSSHHASGARATRSAAPIDAHAVRQPADCTTAPTNGNAAMNPMLHTNGRTTMTTSRRWRH